ncbi:hypothetical protein [Catellatospora tritici]|uniref:hypothetical protein n=1 Tax=Catellatospora tritici TaxID=2851566 RepID=UPI001C2CDAF5|nr:hypothetical protein [Catellatospora tritici]MBV1854674.1 hypothetical protein [Catellatospora tritici]
MRPALRRGLLLLTAIVVVNLGLPVAGASAAAKLSHRKATDMFRDAGITWWSSGNCADRNKPSCTSFEDVRRTTVEGLLTLREASDCAIMVTGGTETGHGSGTYTHWNGWKLDISKYSCIGNYIKKYFKYVGLIKGWGYQYRAPSGNLYTDEGNHWDIIFYSCGGCDDGANISPSPSTSPAPGSPAPSASPSLSPSPAPSASPSASSSASPSPSPAAGPIVPVGTPSPSVSPSTSLSPSPSPSVSHSGSVVPGVSPSALPGSPAPSPTGTPSAAPAASPSSNPDDPPWGVGAAPVTRPDSVRKIPPSGVVGPGGTVVGDPALPRIPGKVLRSVDPEPSVPPRIVDPARIGAPLG